MSSFEPTRCKSRQASAYSSCSSPIVGRALERAHLAHGQQHAGHERLAVDRVVSDRERLAGPAEQDLLVGHQAGQAHRVDRLVDVPAGRRDQLRGARRGARRGVELAVVMQLDDLALGHVARGLLGELHHQHRPDREVRRHEQVALPHALQRGEVGAGRAHHAVHAGLETGAGVGEGRVGSREVDHHVRVPEHVARASPPGAGRRAPRGPGRPRPPRLSRPSVPCARRRRRRRR